MAPNGIGPFNCASGSRRFMRNSPREDVDLVALTAGGDAGAFALLYDRHSRAAYFVAHGITHERQAAEDVLQNAFFRVWRAAGTY